MLQENCCENCRYARKTDIDGLIDCEKDGRSKDADMVCEDYKNRSINAMALEVFAALGWYLFIISPIIWRAFYNWYDDKHKDDET